jgi:hypothetical protein
MALRQASAERGLTVRSNGGGWSGWMRPSLEGAEDFPIRVQAVADLLK